MCGISGRVGAPVSDAVLRQQLDLLTHRGPDADGAFAYGDGVVAQNRLAIIDLEHGDPPLTNENGTIGAVLNGEIYNFREIRAGLQRRGHVLRTQGDTEVLAHLAEDCAPAEIATALDGMFAFAVWDGARQRLVLGRDRLGKKPLYYWSDGEVLVFGSEIKAVLADPLVPRRLDPEAIPAYLTFGYVPTPRTFFAEIRSVPPGHVLVFDGGSPPRLEQYWQLEPSPGSDGPADLARAAAEVRDGLTRAVEKRLIADVPLGAFLSGGLDSSAIVAILAGPLGRKVETFTIGFDDQDGFDERPHARRVASLWHTNHHEFVVAPNAVDLVDRLVWHHDQPFGDSSAVPTFLLNEMTRQHVTVALSGDGGDELYAGYERFAAALASRRVRQLPAGLLTTIQRGAGAMPAGAFRGRAASLSRFLRHAGEKELDAYRSWVGFFDDGEVARLAGAQSDWALAAYRSVWNSAADEAPLQRLLDLNMRTYLLDDLLVKADRMSMAHGLEVRSPFLDVELVAHARSLPSRLKVHRLTLKRVLKEAVSDLLPPAIIKRRKKGFGVPLDRWFREDLAGYVSSTLGAADARVREHLDGTVLDAMLAEHAAGQAERGQQLWTLLTLELFLRREGW